MKSMRISPFALENSFVQDNITLRLYKVHVWFCFCTKTVPTFLLQTQAHKVYREVTSWYPDGVFIFQSRSEKNLQ